MARSSSSHAISSTLTAPTSISLDSFGSFQICGADAVDFLSRVPAETFDLVITDPPYESLEKHRAVGTTTRLKVSKASSNPWFRIFPNSRFEGLFAEVFRTLKQNRHFYLFCDSETMFHAKPAAERAGFKFWKPLIWDKQNIGMGYHYRARYECILFFEKGKRRVNDQSVPDVLRHRRIFRGLPAEKPVDLCRVLVSQSSQRGELVCDPFVGSGSAGRAAICIGRHFVGNDISTDATALARERLLRDAGHETMIVSPI